MISPKQLGRTESFTDIPAGGVIPLAGRAETYRIVVLTQTTTGQVFTFPNPTDVSVVMSIDVINNGTAPFNLYGNTINQNSATRISWNGVNWLIPSELAAPSTGALSTYHARFTSNIQGTADTIINNGSAFGSLFSRGANIIDNNNGTVTLQPGTYKLKAYVHGDSSGSSASYWWADSSSPTTQLGSRGGFVGTTSAASQFGDQPAIYNVALTTVKTFGLVPFYNFIIGGTDDDRNGASYFEIEQQPDSTVLNPSLVTVIDDDSMSSALPTNVSSSESIKAYIDANVSNEVLAYIEVEGSAGLNLTSASAYGFNNVTLDIGTNITRSGGQFTLKAGGLYRLEAILTQTNTTTGDGFQWYNSTTSTYFGRRGSVVTSTFAFDNHTAANALIKPTTDIIVELRATGGTITNISYGIYATIEEKPVNK